jgi:hypothetical protein
MSTDIERDELAVETATATEEPQVNLEELLEFKREHVHGDMTPCPSCTLLVPINARRCQHCESNIEANNALVRETLRHIDEISAQLEAEGHILDRAWRSVKNRIKRAFGGTTTIEGIVPEGDGRRVLTGVEAGAQLTVVAVHGAWALARTDDGREGWVYSAPADRG